MPVGLFRGRSEVYRDAVLVGSNGAHEFAELRAVVRVYLHNRFLKELPR